MSTVMNWPGSRPADAVSADVTTIGSSADALQGWPENALKRWLLQTLDPGSVALWLTTALVTGLLLGQWIWLSRQRPEPLLLTPAPRSDAFQLDVNSASWVEWIQLRGIGPNLANRIIADRRLHGPYRTPDDLQRVPGIGPETLQRLGSALTIRHENSNAEIERSLR
ncbi:MAG: ComEA family DNA-binding protein [Planctomycetota bacterium]